MHVIQPLAVKTSYYVHDIAVDNGAMKRPWLGLLGSYCLYLGPLSLVYIELMDVIKPLLVCIHATKNVNLACTDDSGVSVARLRRRAVCPVYLVPVIREETVLKDVVHCIVAIPTSKDEHRILEHDS